MLQRVIVSPIGQLLLAEQDGMLCEIRLLQTDADFHDCDPVLDETERQLKQYFTGKREAFDLPMKMKGSAFDRAVWRQLMEIPFGETRTYGQIAAALGKPAASRAVGGACSRNPLLIVAPCHRVVASTGRLTGFAAGLDAKRVLLEHEGWMVREEHLVFRIE
ncbi:MAG: methylated-DNA--[protein]-cysteine S-methyltransferase [Clostridiales bacterium]|nr:methylated-DNA--[protein]-cysteine S-methyltransferase [Clostridiales bacterium]